MTRIFRCSILALVVAALGAGVLGCGSALPGAYETCDYGYDACPGGLVCYDTTLPASAGYSGALCTTVCTYSTDCPQLVANYDAICVNGQCYIQCPAGGSTCPYGTGCLEFSDQSGNPIDLCTP
jgi:hypothetical protein